MISKESKQVPIIKEDENAILRYDKLKSVGKEILKNSSFFSTGHITESDAKLGEKILIEGLRQINPPLWDSFLEHMSIAPKLGKTIALSAVKKGQEINPFEIEFLLYLHDIGRLVTPSAYLRHDFIGNRLLTEFGISKSLQDKLPSTEKLMATAETLNLTPKQLRFQEPLAKEQIEISANYFNEMCPTTRIINLADNLGKKDKNGLFTLKSFITYIKSQECRYDQQSDWPSIKWALPRRQAGAVLGVYTIQNTVDWLTNLGLNLDKIRSELII